MIELLQGTNILPGGYETQAWIVSSGAFAMMLLKMGMWIKSWKANGSNNGARAVMSLGEGEFRGQVRSLLDNQLKLMEKIHYSQVNDISTWASSLTQMLTLQQSMAKMLDKHSTMLVEHDKNERKVWQQMLLAIESFQIDTQKARDQAFAEVASIKDEIRSGYKQNT